MNPTLNHDIDIPNAQSHPSVLGAGGLPASRSSSSLASSSIASSLLAPAAPPLDSSQSELATYDHSVAAPATTNPSKNRFFPISSARSPSPGHMGQSQSGTADNATLPLQVPAPVSSSASSIASSTGSRFKRAWGRRKKSEDISAILDDAPIPSSKGKDRAVSAPLSTTTGARQSSEHQRIPSAPPIKTGKPLLPIQLTSPFNVFATPPPPMKLTQSQMSKDLPPPPESAAAPSKEQLNIGSLIVSPSTAAAIQLLQVSELQPKEKDPKERSAPRETLRRPSTAKERTDHEMKQDWRKSDSTTISHSTIRPGAFGNRSPRPVSLAESSHSGHTIVPVNRRLSALITDAEFAMPEEGDVTDSSQEFAIPKFNSRASPASSVKARNRRSMSLNYVPGSFTPPKPKPGTADSSTFTVKEGSFATLHRTFTETNTTSTTPDSPPIITKTDAKGFIAPLQPPGAAHSTGSNIRGRLAAWTSTAASSRRADQPPVSPPAYAQRMPVNAPTQSSFRQTAVSITGQTAAGIALGIGKRAANKVTRVWGGLSSSSSSTSGHSTSSSNSGTPSSYHSSDLGRSASEQSMPSHSGGMWKVKRRTPNAPSGSWSVTSSLASSSVSDFDTPTGPILGTRIRGPKRTATGSHVAGGLVFGRDLATCVNETAINSTLISKEFGRQSEEAMALRPLEKRLLPALVVRCSQHLLQWGVQEEGLFRVTGRPTHVAKLRSEFDTGADYNLVECGPGDLDPHAVASIFKAYLRELPQPLLTSHLIPLFEAVMTPDAKEEESASGRPGHMRVGSRGPTLPSGPRAGAPLALRKPPSLSTLAMPSFAGMRTLSEATLLALAGLVAQLPPYNRDLLYTVVELIRATSARVKETKMTLGNLLLVFCPSLNMSPSLLRVLCEAGKIWDGPPQEPAESVVIDITAPVLDIAPTDGSADPSSHSAAPSPHADNDTKLTNVGAGPMEDSLDSNDAVPRPRVRHPVSTFYGTALEVPTASTLDRLSSNSGQDDSASYVSALDGPARTNSAPSSLADSPRIPQLSCSTDSLATPSTMSENPSFSSEPITRESSSEKSEQLPIGTPLVAESEELPLPSSRRPIISSPIPFPSTDSSVPQPGLTRRKSYNLLSFPPLKSDSSNSSPASPASPSSTWSRRNSRPSLRLLFSKRSASPLTTPSSATNPPPASALSTTCVYHDSLASAAPIPFARADTPPVLTTDISSSPIRLFGSSALRDDPTSRHVQDESLEPPAVHGGVNSSTSSLYSTPQHTPTVDRSGVPLVDDSSLSVRASNFLRSPSQCSLTPSIDLNIEDDAEDDWAQSVLTAAGSSMTSRRTTLKEPMKVS
ncbi:unnamed protein product [Somion occarium]|uniref:Rho-GAP domain-containing protein n=1 Tax=Somion occarium TaxID=3059160 RepID=A0ABP1DGS5_9APHY